MLRLALIGKGISHSYSPEIHRIGAALSQVACSYELLDMEDASQLGALRADLRPFSYTHLTLPTNREV